MKQELDDQADINMDSASSNKLNIINVMRAVIILTHAERKELRDIAVIKLVSHSKFIDKVTNFDDHQIQKWQVNKIKEITSTNWVPGLFKNKSQCAGHFAEWIDIILKIKQTISPPKKDVAIK